MNIESIFRITFNVAFGHKMALLIEHNKFFSLLCRLA